MKNFGFAFGVAATLLAIAAPPTRAAEALAGDVARITINDLDFAPSAITVRLGDTVEWPSKDIVERTATARNGAFDVATPKGKAARVRMRKLGAVEYFCRLHPNMVGVIEVVR